MSEIEVGDKVYTLAWYNYTLSKENLVIPTNIITSVWGEYVSGDPYCDRKLFSIKDCYKTKQECIEAFKNRLDEL